MKATDSFPRKINIYTCQKAWTQFLSPIYPFNKHTLITMKALGQVKMAKGEVLNNEQHLKIR